MTVPLGLASLKCQSQLPQMTFWNMFLLFIKGKKSRSFMWIVCLASRWFTWNIKTNILKNHYNNNKKKECRLLKTAQRFKGWEQCNVMELSGEQWNTTELNHYYCYYYHYYFIIIIIIIISSSSSSKWLSITARFPFQIYHIKGLNHRYLFWSTWLKGLNEF